MSAARNPRAIADEAIAAILAASRTIKRRDRRLQFFGHVSFALSSAIGHADDVEPQLTKGFKAAEQAGRKTARASLLDVLAEYERRDGPELGWEDVHIAGRLAVATALMLLEVEGRTS